MSETCCLLSLFSDHARESHKSVRKSGKNGASWGCTQTPYSKRPSTSVRWECERKSTQVLQTAWRNQDLLVEGLFGLADSEIVEVCQRTKWRFRHAFAWNSRLVLSFMSFEFSVSNSNFVLQDTSSEKYYTSIFRSCHARSARTARLVCSLVLWYVLGLLT